MNRVLLDTNILIYLLNGNSLVRKSIEDKSWVISFVNEMELLVKTPVNKVELNAIFSLLKECFIIEMNTTIKQKAIQNANQYGIKLIDSIVLATAQTNSIPLITADLAFRKIAEKTNEVLLFVP
jgi:predicted nucleic acid-binding protein